MTRSSGARSKAAAAKIRLEAWMSAPANVTPSGVRRISSRVDHGEPEQLECVDQRQKIVDLQVQLVGELRDARSGRAPP